MAEEMAGLRRERRRLPERGRKPGGEDGHKGTTLTQAARPDGGPPQAGLLRPVRRQPVGPSTS